MRDLERGQTQRREDAVRDLWEYFFADLACHARKRLRAMNAPTGPADEEDAAERAFTKVCRAIERGRLKLGHRVDLQKVLLTATAREVLDLHHRAKRAAGTTSDEAVLSQVPDRAPAPELLMLALDACQRLLRMLETDVMRRVALWKLAGCTNEAIGAKLGCSVATVERTLARIRDTWKREWADAVANRPARSGPRGPAASGWEDCDIPRTGPVDPSDAGRFLRDAAGFG
jgi:DNA-directed RNA polymerase specialized sigma24 family protein